MAIQADGKIIIGGQFTTVNGTACNSIARLNIDGSLDSGFDALLPEYTYLTSVAVQPDGQIVIGGSLIARLHSDGTLDTTFNASADSTIECVSLQPDGKIILGGLFTQVDGVGYHDYIARLNLDGTLDTSFNATTDAVVYTVALQDDGRIIVGGQFALVDGSSSPSIARLNGDPPSIVSASSAAAQIGQAFTFQIGATFKPTSYNATDLPPGIVINTAAGIISGTPTTMGSYPVTVSATNASGTGSATLTINVVPPAPSITSGAPPNGQVGAAYSFQVAATNSPTSFAVSSLPPGFTFNATTGLINGTPTQAGTFNVTFLATNGGGTGSASYSLTILPSMPTILSAASASGQVGQPFVYQIAASNSPTNYNAVGLPAGLNIDTTSGLITGSPTEQGTFPITLSAVNAGGTGTLAIT